MTDSDSLCEVWLVSVECLCYVADELGSVAVELGSDKDWVPALERLSRRHLVLADRDVHPVPRPPSPRQLVDTLVLGVRREVRLAKRRRWVKQAEVGLLDRLHHPAMFLLGQK